jgi:hypothetical protein
MVKLHRELWPAYNPNIASPQASTEGLFQQTQALAQACAVCSPKSGSGDLSSTLLRDHFVGGRYISTKSS